MLGMYSEAGLHDGVWICQLRSNIQETIASTEKKKTRKKEGILLISLKKQLVKKKIPTLQDKTLAKKDIRFSISNQQNQKIRTDIMCRIDRERQH